LLSLGVLVLPFIPASGLLFTVGFVLAERVLYIPRHAQPGAYILISGLHVLPHNAKLHYNFGNLLKDTGRPIEAMSHYEKAIKYWPEYSSAHNNLGTLL
ncbi:hypothetical protein CAPTEDRAFT_30250, partial [Capitella teleta]